MDRQARIGTPAALANLGFVSAGVAPNGLPRFVCDRPTRVVRAGERINLDGAPGWGAWAATTTGTGVEEFPGTFGTPGELADALRAAGWVR